MNLEFRKAHSLFRRSNGPWTEEEQRLLREAEQQEGVLGTMK